MEVTNYHSTVAIVVFLSPLGLISLQKVISLSILLHVQLFCIILVPNVTSLTSLTIPFLQLTCQKYPTVFSSVMFAQIYNISNIRIFYLLTYLKALCRMNFTTKCSNLLMNILLSLMYR